MHLRKGGLFAAAVLLAGLAVPVQAQDAPPFKRVLAVTTPRTQGADVLMVQRRLLELGYSETGEADAYFGPKSAQAVERFRYRNGIPKGNTVDVAVWEILFSHDDIAVRGEQGKDKLSVVVADAGLLVGALKSDGVWIDSYITATNIDASPIDLRFLTESGAWRKGKGTVNWNDPATGSGIDLLADGNRDYTLAVQSGFDPQPRPVLVVSKLSEQLSKAIADALHARGVPKVGSTKVWSADWNADGKTDYVVNSESEDVRAPDSHSVVFVLSGNAAGGFEKPLFVAEKIGPAANPEPGFDYTIFALDAIADLDGDAKYELVISERVVDGLGILLVKIDGGKAKTLRETWIGN